MAWLWKIPPEWHGILKLNLLKLLYSSTSIYMTIQQLGQGYQILAFIDIPSALGWIHKSSFSLVEEERHYTIDRKLG